MSFNSMAFEWIVHRGNANGASENSIEAVFASSAVGADVVELDVQISKDKVVYLFHDKFINGEKLANLTYSQITTLASREQVPRLETVLSLGTFNGTYLLDLKFSGTNNLELLAKLIRSAPVSMEKIAIQTNDIEMLNYGNKILPECQYFYLERLSRKMPFFIAPDSKQILKKISGLNLQGISIKGRGFVNAEYINALKSPRRKVYVWTINDIKRAKHYISIGADGVITDYVEEMKKIK